MAACHDGRALRGEASLWNSSPPSPFHSCWSPLPDSPQDSPHDNWSNVYQWIRTTQQWNSSEGGDSTRSSTDSQPQHTPNAPSWGTTTEEGEPWLLPPASHSMPTSSSSPSYAAVNKEYNLIEELLKLNIHGAPSGQEKRQAASPLAPPHSAWKMPSEEPKPLRKDDSDWAQWAPVETNNNGEWPPMEQMNRQQQNFYEHVYSLMLAGQLPVPPLSVWSGSVAAAAASRQLAMRRTGAAMELHVRLEEASEEYRQLEKERKKTEAELARHHLGKKISSSNTMPIPRLPSAPSRVDRLVVDFFREHARIVTLLSKMEQLRAQPLPAAVHSSLQTLLQSITVLQQCRLNERNAILQQLRGECVRYNEEKETLALASALSTVRKAVVRARAANWCSLVWTIGGDEDDLLQVERLVAADFQLAPPAIKQRAVS